MFKKREKLLIIRNPHIFAASIVRVRTIDFQIEREGENSNILFSDGCNG